MGMYSVQLLIPMLRKIIVTLGAFEDDGFDNGFLIG